MDNNFENASESQDPNQGVQNSPLHEGNILFAHEAVKDLPASERFRMIRAKIERQNLVNDAFHIIAVTSSVQGEGKSLVSANLVRALSLDPLGKSLIVDCDLRKPQVHNFFGLSRRPGITDAIFRNIPLESVTNSVAPGLDVITAGSELIDPTQGIERPEFASLLQEMRDKYRYVIIDCPPVLLCPEPITISLIADCTILVVRGWHTARNLVHEAVDAIGKNRILGVILNDGDDASREYLDYGYYGYREQG